MLDLEGNSVEELGQVRYLHLCPRLATLTLEGNPVCLQPGPGPPCQVRALEPTGAGATARVPEGSLSPLVGLEPGLERGPRAGPQGCPLRKGFSSRVPPASLSPN